jgi:hypothetical protein
MKNPKINVVVGTRVTNAPMLGKWGTIVEVYDRRKDPKASVRIAAKASKRPFTYTVRWDDGTIEKTKGKEFWFHNDNPGFGRPILKDPTAGGI